MIDPKRVENLKGLISPPAEYAGQWVAWDSREQSKIVAHGADLNQVIQAAHDQGFANPLLQRGRDPRIARI